MSTLYKFSVCLSDIPKEAIKIASNGKAYINGDLWLNEAKNTYGQVGSIKIDIKIDGGYKDIYIGNLYPFEPKQNTEIPNSWEEFLAK
jgi:hypothetical protein